MLVLVLGMVIIGSSNEGGKQQALTKDKTVRDEKLKKQTRRTVSLAHGTCQSTQLPPETPESYTLCLHVSVWKKEGASDSLDNVIKSKTFGKSPTRCIEEVKK